MLSDFSPTVLYHPISSSSFSPFFQKCSLQKSVWWFLQEEVLHKAYRVYQRIPLLIARNKTYNNEAKTRVIPNNNCKFASLLSSHHQCLVCVKKLLISLIWPSGSFWSSQEQSENTLRIIPYIMSCYNTIETSYYDNLCHGTSSLNPADDSLLVSYSMSMEIWADFCPKQCEGTFYDSKKGHLHKIIKKVWTTEPTAFVDGLFYQ